MKQRFSWIAFILAIFLLSNSSNSQTSKTFKVINKSGFSVTSVRLSQSNANEWSMELNTMDKVANNGSFDFGTKVDPARCMYDIKFTAEDGTEYFVKDIDLCKAKEISLEVGQGNLQGDPGNNSDPSKSTDTKTDVPPPTKDK